MKMQKETIKATDNKTKGAIIFSMPNDSAANPPQCAKCGFSFHFVIKPEICPASRILLNLIESQTSCKKTCIIFVKAKWLTSSWIGHDMESSFVRKKSRNSSCSIQWIFCNCMIFRPAFAGFLDHRILRSLKFGTFAQTNRPNCP